MTTNKRKKNSRQHGYTTHGCGSMKKRRGAGNRGGRGKSGSGKRGDQKKPMYWKEKKLFGKFGFKSKSRSPETTPINIRTIEDRADSWVRQGKAKETNGAYIIDLGQQGYNKLLSTGNATKKLMITVDTATDAAKEKIEKAGGEVKTLQKKPKKQEAKPHPAEKEGNQETKETGEEAKKPQEESAQ